MIGTTWTLLSSVALASEHIFGNGYSLAITNGLQSKVGLAWNNTAHISYNTNGYGALIPNADGSGSSDIANGNSLGVTNSAQNGANPEYSGLVADTLTLYTWERTA